MEDRGGRYPAGNGLANAAPIRVLEFYSGIGGMRYSLMDAKVNAEVVEAFDINDVANDVYEYNFTHRPHQGNIQSLTSADIDCYAADAWLLSPPCQPYTRQGLRKQSNDARASSFTQILELLKDTKHPPSILFVENVVGFETSDTHFHMMKILKTMNFTVLEFLFSPLQFGIPYSRPRYFCLAKRKTSLSNNKLIDAPIIHSPKVIGSEDLTLTCDSIKKYMESEEEENYVPVDVIKRWGSAMDVVYDDSNRCCCFTKSYYRYVKGTGSVLATHKANNLIDMKLRFFSPREVANFHSFPKSFQFPPHICLKQCYALLGNSLSVAVVSPLLRFLFSEEM